ncbi:MAG: hypothetical protein AAF721_23355 [Myxococcota bacterium]
MAFDPAADPWGTAMLGSATVVALAVFVLVAAIMTGTPKRAGARILGVGCFLFLLTAAGGTWDRIVSAEDVDREANKPRPPPVTIVAPPPPPDPDAGPSPAGSDGAGSGGPDDAGAAPTTPPDPGTATPTAIANPPPAAGDPPAAAASGSLAPTAPAVIDTSPVELAAPTALPADAEGKKTAMSTAIRLAKAVAADETDCADPKRVAEAWLSIKSFAADTRGLKTAVSRLEGCRKRIRAARAYWVRRKRVEARNAYADELPGKLKRDDSYVFVSVRGPAHERMRIGGKSITAQRVAALIRDGLADELKALGFSEVTFASGKTTTTQKYDSEDDSAVTDKVMGRWGLQSKLSVR